MDEIHKEILIGLLLVVMILGIFGSMIYLGASIFFDFLPYSAVLGGTIGLLGIYGLHTTYWLVYESAKEEKNRTK